MDTYRHSIDPAASADGASSASTVGSVQSEFSQLIAIFDLQLSRLADDDPERSHVQRAKDAAVRGLELSRHLEGLLAKKG